MAKRKAHVRGWLIGLVSVFLALACEAPHNNPFDPQNPRSQRVTLTGTVSTFDSPKRPIAGALVLWPSQNRMTVSDADGRFQMPGLAPQSGHLFVQKEGFVTDSMWIDLNSGLSSLDILLHALPVMTGRVMSARMPPVPLDEVKVTWLPGNQYTYTNSGGYYRFENPPIGAGALLFERTGYKTLSAQVEWRGESMTQNVFMNAVPVVSGYQIYSIVENNYGPRRTYRMVVEALITDQENDIDSVYIACSALGIKEQLAYDVLSKKFHRSFSVLDLKLTSLNQVVGHDFTLHVVDQEGDDFALGNERVERVIADEIEIDSPINSQTVEKPFRVKWLPFAPGFPFTYSVEIYTDDDFTPDLVWQKEKIPADSLEQTIIADLPATEYVWMIWCIDEFQNRSRSKPGSFKIVELP